MGKKTGEKERGEKKPGPEPERLKLPHEDWTEAVKEALERSGPSGQSEDDREPK